jgi:CRISPR-associated endonuclease/helicase Cas3
MTSCVYAHSVEGRPPAAWEPLPVHAEAVARLAARFADALGARAWGELAGQWHDLGKYQPAFQDYILAKSPSGPPHAWAGAVLALSRGPALMPLAFAIAGHHCSLADMRRDEAAGVHHGPTPLAETVQQFKELFKELQAVLPREELMRPLPPLPPFLTGASAGRGKVEMFTRFLFSALVDADRLATGRFYAQFKPALTADDLHYDNLPTLQHRLDEFIDALPAKGSPAVAELRRQVLATCRGQAGAPPGRFSLTVPTGGGKTLSAMSFALNHAVCHTLRRVIVVIPYTSIIEQSARVYREVLGAANVLEHHSNLDEQALSEQDARGEQLRKIAAENWDAPVVVTTTVQFFESLLSNHPGRCRKLHNIARSVVILDEVQTLPPEYLATVTDVLTQLTDHYGCSVVLTTATPPALVKREAANQPGLTAVREIVPDPSALARAARRVAVEWRLDVPTSYTALAEELRTYRQALAIVHRRDDARTLAEQVGDGVLHLSALMCPAHRLEVVAEVRRRLAADEPCVLVSTQLIEAGVDVDFPVVYRALAGLDSLAQSAGRCDREGRRTEALGGRPGGRLIVFRAETDPPPGVPRKALQSVQGLLALGGIDPFEPADSIRFFNDLYGKCDLDQHAIELLRNELKFATVAATFRLIDADTQAVVVPWGDARERLAAFRRTPCRTTQRALQPYTVQVRRYRLEEMKAAGVVSPVIEGEDSVYAICEGFESTYSRQFGLKDMGDGTHAVDVLVGV